MRHRREPRQRKRKCKQEYSKWEWKSPFLTSLEVLESIQHVLTQHTNTHSTNIQIITLTSWKQNSTPTQSITPTHTLIGLGYRKASVGRRFVQFVLRLVRNFRIITTHAAQYHWLTYTYIQPKEATTNHETVYIETPFFCKSLLILAASSRALPSPNILSLSRAFVVTHTSTHESAKTKQARWRFFWHSTDFLSPRWKKLI